MSLNGVLVEDPEEQKNPASQSPETTVSPASSQYLPGEQAVQSVSTPIGASAEAKNDPAGHGIGSLTPAGQ